MADEETLDQELEQAEEELALDTDEANTEVEQEQPEVPAFELPSYTTRWKADARDALSAFGGNPELRGQLDPILKQIEETNRYVGQREQELAQLNKRYEPLNDTLSQIEHQYNLQGMSLDMGLKQLVGSAQFLATNPDQALPWLAGTYRPRDPSAALQAMAQSWGVDMGQLAQEAPYIDPSVTQIVGPLQQEINRLKQKEQEREALLEREKRDAIQAQIHAFAAETNEDGTPKHPHIERLEQEMARLIVGGLAKDLPSAYRKAERLDDELQAQLAAEKAKKDAATRSTAAKKAVGASQSVVGKGSGSSKPEKTTEQAMREQLGLTDDD